jgi:RNA polymerase sigma factor (TIGR02999 family)
VDTTDDALTTPITRLLREWRSGDAEAGELLFHRIYGELRRIARGQLRGRGRDATLGTTALVHEAYLRLLGADNLEIRDRAHLMAIAATAMRQIAVDYARRQGAVKRGGEAVRVEFDDNDGAAAPVLAEVLAVHGALARLEDLDPRMGKIVEMRFFAGMSVEEVAEALGVSERTVKRDWRTARAFLHRELASEPSS